MDILSFYTKLKKNCDTKRAEAAEELLGMQLDQSNVCKAARLQGVHEGIVLVLTQAKEIYDAQFRPEEDDDEPSNPIF